MKWKTGPVPFDLCHPREDVTHLSVQCDGTGLALGADSLWPWRMTLAARLDLTANVLQCCKLSSKEEQNNDYTHKGKIYWENQNNSLLVSATGQLAKVRVE